MFFGSPRVWKALEAPVAVLVWGLALGALLWGTGVDAAIQVWLFDHYHQGFNSVMRVLGEMGKGTFQIGLVVLVVGGLWLRERSWNGRGLRELVWVLPVFALAGVLNWLLKVGVGRGRPKEFLMNGASPFEMHPFAPKAVWWSYPSGHSASTWAIAVWLGLAFPRYRVAFWGVAVVLSFSRFLALTPHYLGDVVAGAAVGAFVAMALWNLRNQGTEEPRNQGKVVRRKGRLV